MTEQTPDRPDPSLRGWRSAGGIVPDAARERGPDGLTSAERIEKERDAARYRCAELEAELAAQDDARAIDEALIRADAQQTLLEAQAAARAAQDEDSATYSQPDPDVLTAKVRAIVHHSHDEDHAVRGLVSWLITGPLARADLAARAAQDEDTAHECAATREVHRLHSWDGLMELLDEHWPADTFPTLPDREGREPGPRIVSLIRTVDHLRSQTTRPPATPAELDAIHALQAGIRADLAAHHDTQPENKDL